LFNFVLAIVLTGLAVFIYGEQDLHDAPQISQVMKNSPAESAGVKSGDTVLELDGKKIGTWAELADTIHHGNGQAVHFLIERRGEQLRLDVLPEKKEVQLPTGDKQAAYFVGITPQTVSKPASFVRSVYFGVIWTLDKTALTYLGLWGMVSGKVSPKDLAGPIFIIDTAGKQAQQGFDSVLYFTALLSVSLAVLNLLPIPVLDGGHLLFFVIEALMGSISVRKKEFAQQVGMVLLLSLMVFALYNDISRDPKSISAGQVNWEEDSKKSEKE
jgi:regulator of sigma E protease